LGNLGFILPRQGLKVRVKKGLTPFFQLGVSKIPFKEDNFCGIIPGLQLFLPVKGQFFHLKHPTHSLISFQGGFLTRLVHNILGGTFL